MLPLDSRSSLRYGSAYIELCMHIVDVRIDILLKENEVKIGKILVAATIGTGSAAGMVQSQTYSNYGNQTYGNDGSVYSQYGNQTYGNDGSVYSQYGNQVYGNDGSVLSQYGNQTYGNDGTVFSQYGNQTYGNDGTVCSQYGNQVICN